MACDALIKDPALLNVASRLQGAIKDKDKSPQGKVLMTRSMYASIPTGVKHNYKASEVERNLRNIAGGGNYKAVKLDLFKSS